MDRIVTRPESVDAAGLAAWLADGAREKPLLLDVREGWEVALCTIAGSTVIPLNELPARLGELDPARPVVCICHHGVRSLHAAHFLASKGFGRTWNLSGGIEAWARKVDPTMARY